MFDVVFIILNYCSWKDTERLTREIISEEIPSSKILIVDNCSPNDSYEQLQGLVSDSVELIRTDKNGGFAKGNNFGLRYAAKYNPKYVCIINNDIHFTGETIKSLISYYDVIPDIGIISPLQYDTSGKPVVWRSLKCPTLWDDIICYFAIRIKKKHIYELNTTYGNVQRVDIIPGAFMFASYQTLSDADFFDESTFLFGEERFIFRRLQAIGKKNYVVLNQHYIHDHSVTIHSTTTRSKQSSYFFHSHAKYHLKYGPLPHLMVAVLWVAYMFGRLKDSSIIIIKRTLLWCVPKLCPERWK